MDGFVNQYSFVTNPLRLTSKTSSEQLYTTYAQDALATTESDIVLFTHVWRVQCHRAVTL